ncbi:hypothetical protein B0H12DRAFT_1077448 [Mycena haematopus]|nr:hypothetical protein B0H12DRAFT_1077448 [Mycena haematopus]
MFADYWLAKGRRGKLDLKIHMDFPFDLADMVHIARLIAAQARDWQKLTLVASYDDVAQYVTAWMAENAFPSLEEIELHTTSWSIWHGRFDALAALPRLHTVRLKSQGVPSIYHDLPLLSLPWSQLRSFSLSVPVSGRKCLDMLTNCLELTTLEVRVLADHFAGELRPPVTLLKLSSLRLVSGATFWNRTSYIEPFLDVLHLPMLIDLELSFIGGADPWNPLVSRFWQAHAAQLRTFKLFNLYFRADLRLLFLTMPNLTSLQLGPREIRLTSPDFEALRVEQLLPALTCLDVAVGHARGVQPLNSIRSAIALLEARATVATGLGVARLAQATIADWTDWDVVERDLKKVDPVAMGVELERLRALKAQGMDVRWQVGGYDVLVPADNRSSRYNISIRTASSRPSSAADHHSDSDAALPISYPNAPFIFVPKKPKRNLLRRLYQWIKKLQRGSM